MNITDIITNQNQIMNSANLSPEQMKELSQRISSVDELLSGLKAGDSISAKVIAKDGNTLTLSLPNNALFEAKLSGNINLDIGKLLTFEVKSSVKGLLLSPLFTNLSTDPNVTKALKMASLPVTSDTVLMTRQMMSAGMSVDRNSLNNVFKDAVAYPDSPVTDIVDLHRLGIPVNETNLEQIDAYKNLSYKIGEGMNNVLNDLSLALTDSLKDGNMQQAAKLFMGLADLAAGIEETASENNAEGAANISGSQSDLQGEKALGSLNGDNSSNVVSSDGKALAGAFTGDISEIGNSNAGVSAENLEVKVLGGSDNLQALDGKAPQEANSIIKIGSAGAQNEGLITRESQDGKVVTLNSDNRGVSSFSEGVNTEGSSINRAQTDALAKSIKNFDSSSLEQDKELTAAQKALRLLSKVTENDVTKDAAKEGLNNDQAALNKAFGAEKGVTDTEAVSASNKVSNFPLLNDNLRISLFTELQKFYEDGTDLSNKSMQELFNITKNLLSDAFSKNDTDKLSRLVGNKVIKDSILGALNENWSITPDQVSEKEKVMELYSRLGKQLVMVSKMLESAGLKDSPAQQSVTNMSGNLDFLNQVNQMYSYIQLPIRLSGGDSAHGDLYVYSNGKRLNAKDGKVSALLHLDMEHLGPVDVYVAMDSSSYDKKLNTHFYVADEKILDFIESHMDELTSRLAKKGYSVSAKTRVKGDSSGKDEPEHALSGGINGILSQTSGIKLSEYSFDVRT